MPSSAVLDTALGLALFFFTLAVLCSAAVESCANLFRKRAKYLLRGLRDLLDAAATTDPARPAGVRAASARVKAATDDERALYRSALTAQADTSAAATWTDRVMGHPLVTPFKQSRPAGGKTRNPAYLPAAAFASALLSEILGAPQGATTIATVRDAVTRLDDNVPFKGALVSLLTSAGQDLGKFVTGLEAWYDAQMDQIGGAYRRWAKRWLIVFALVATLALHLDAIAIGRSLYTSPTQREVVVAAAADGTLCPTGQPFDTTRTCVDTELGHLGAAGLPIGWSAPRAQGIGARLLELLGLLLTAAAASLGAPFWFDVLNRLGSLRNSGRPPHSSTS
jgi:hypothetical protein